MFNEEDIYSRLLDGENVDDIAKEITDMLNAAQAKFVEEAARKAEEEERKAREAEQTKVADRKHELIFLLDYALSWIARYYPALGITEKDWDDEDLEVIAGLVFAILNAEVGKKASKILNTDEIFDKFFGTFGLKS